MPISDRTLIWLALEEHMRQGSLHRPCDRVGYPTSAAAKAALAHLRARKGTRRRKAERRTYKCGRCGMWHVTSMTK